MNCTDKCGLTPAYYCCTAGNVKILHLLIQHGADLSLVNTFGRSPAHVASMYGRVKMLALINRVNTDLIHQCDNVGMTPLLIARKFGHNETAKWLIEHGAEEVSVVQQSESAKELKGIQVLSQRIQMYSSSLTRPYISHISSPLHCRLTSRRPKKGLDWRDWRLSIARTRSTRQIEQSKALD